MTTATCEAFNLPHYQYTRLDHSIKETRLAELLPGEYDDDLCFKLHHVALNSVTASSSEQSRLGVEDLQKDLSDEWTVRETLNGRFIFERKKEYGLMDPYYTTWVHPTAGFEPMANNYNLTDTKPEYEALSHVWGPGSEETVVFIDASAIEPIPASAVQDHKCHAQSTGHSQNIKRKRAVEDTALQPNAKRVHQNLAVEGNSHSDDSHQAHQQSSTQAAALSTSPSSTLSIRGDLATALRHLRQRKRSRVLWVDNICIDQGNTAERSHLVQHMGQIYRLAQRVIAWIGPEYENSKLAMSKLEYLGRQVELTSKGSWRVNAPKCLEPTWSRTSVALPYDDEIWEAIRCLVMRPWFRRLWVWQEAKLSNDYSVIQCGHKKMELYRFGAAVWCIAAKIGAHRTSVPSDLDIPLFRAGDAVLRQFGEPFFNTLLHLNRKECHDPRDKIYGALGLAPPKMADRIVPDYDKEVEQVYTDAAIAHFESTGRVDFLLACDLDNRTLPGPSWVPDWSVPQRQTPRWLLSATLASGISTSQARVERTPRPTLHVQGVECGTICYVGTQAPDNADDLTSLETIIKSWAPHDYNEKQYASQTESLLDAFVKTLLWNTLQERCSFDHCLLTLSEARSAVLSSLTNVTRDMTPDHREKGPHLRRAWYREALGRSFVMLDNGYIGMTSAATEETDVVCVILGCPLPMILRPHSSGRYHVVGPTYIHGLMDAESLLGPLPPGHVVEVGASSGWYGGFTFRNTITNTTVDEDPRLPKLPPLWIRMKAVRMAEDPLHFVRYRNLASGETINGDPRLLPEALRASGVALKALSLV
jgi:hypothetical protein